MIIKFYRIGLVLGLIGLAGVIVSSIVPSGIFISSTIPSVNLNISGIFAMFGFGLYICAGDA